MNAKTQNPSSRRRHGLFASDSNVSSLGIRSCRVRRNRYLEKSGDREILRVVAPFFAFRGLVVASPLWYPTLSDTVRQAIFAFVLGVLDTDSFDPTRVNAYAGV